MSDPNHNLMQTEEYERFRRAVQERIDSGELNAAEAKRIVEALVRRSRPEEDRPDEDADDQAGRR